MIVSESKIPVPAQRLSDTQDAAGQAREKADKEQDAFIQSNSTKLAVITQRLNGQYNKFLSENEANDTLYQELLGRVHNLKEFTRQTNTLVEQSKEIVHIYKSNISNVLTINKEIEQDIATLKNNPNHPTIMKGGLGIADEQIELIHMDENIIPGQQEKVTLYVMRMRLFLIGERFKLDHLESDRVKRDVLEKEIRRLDPQAFPPLNRKRANFKLYGMIAVVVGVFACCLKRGHVD